MAYYSNTVTIEEGAAGLGATQPLTTRPSVVRGWPSWPKIRTAPVGTDWECKGPYESGIITQKGLNELCKPGKLYPFAMAFGTANNKRAPLASRATAVRFLEGMGKQGFVTPYALSKLRPTIAMKGLGADAGSSVGPLLDLGLPAALTELKTAISMTGIMGMVASEEGQKTWPPSFYTSPGWDARATKLWEAATAAYPELANQTFQDPASGQKYPTAKGVMTILGKGVAAPGGDPAMFASTFPTLSAWYAAAVKSPGDAQVAPPKFTEVPAAGIDKVYVYGLGAVAALGVLFVVTRRKRRAHATA